MLRPKKDGGWARGVLQAKMAPALDHVVTVASPPPGAGRVAPGCGWGWGVLVNDLAPTWFRCLDFVWKFDFN